MVSRGRVANCSDDHPKVLHHHQMDEAGDEDYDQAMEHHQLGGGGDYGELYASSWRGRLPKALRPHADWLLVRFRREFSTAVRWFLSKKPQGFRGWLSLVNVNVLITLVLFGTGVITFESSTTKLRDSLSRTVLFPIYLPHAVALPITANSDTPMFMGNFLGFYVVRVYAAWRGGYLVSVSRGGVLFAASIMGASEISLAALLLRRFLCSRPRRKHPSIESISEALLYFATVFLCSLIFGIITAIVIVASPLVAWRNFWQYFGTTWMASLAGMLTVTPPLMNLIVWRPRPTLFRPRKLCEAFVLTAVTGTVTGILFLTNLQAAIHPLPYLLFPIIILAAFRFNRVGCSVAVLFMTYVCCWASIRTKGAVYRMSGSPPVTSPKLIIQVELFVSVLGAVGIMLAAAVREKKRLARDLRTMNEELENTVSQRTQELVMANEDLRESQSKAEDASQAKSDFLANMSHEIRTPIHGITGLTALLLDSELSTDQRESLQSVKECANLLLHIINSILDLAKIEAGRVEVEFVPFNVRKLVSSTMKMLATRAQERHLDLRWDVDSAVPDWMVGDSGKIQQCLLNLVGNAVKFTQEGSVKVRIAIDANYSTIKRGSSRSLDLDDQSKVLSSPLTLSTLSLRDQSIGDSTAINILEKPVEWQPKQKNGFGLWKLRNGGSYGQSVFCVPVLFEVIDTGIGISKEKLKDIFTPFTQADASTSRVYGGTGLGLCIVQRFVELLGGKLLAESELDKGSTFSFSIPLGFSEAQTPEPNTVDFSGSLDNIEYCQLSPDTASEAQLLDTLVPTSFTSNKESEEKDVASSITEQDPINRKELNPVDMKELGPVNLEELDQVSVKELGPVRMKELGDLRDDGWHKTLHLHVLLAEDNVINQKVAVRQLQKHGHRVTVVGDGVGALDAVITNHDLYDLVIMDVQMPNMDGLEATRRIREEEVQRGWRRLPVLGLTAHAIQGYELTCLSSGMDGYLGKPFDINQLLKVMSKYLPVLER